MRITKAIVAIAACLLAVLAQHAWAQDSAANNEPAIAAASPEELARDEALVAAFGASHDAADLKKAVDAITSKPRMTALAEHKSGPDDVALWLKLFAAMDAAEEALPLSKDFRVAISCNVGGGGAPFGPCGPPPWEVEDPAVRSQYEAAIAENERARLAGNNYSRIANLKESVDALFWTWANGMYRGDVDAQARIGQEARALGCSQALVGWIQAITAEARGVFPPKDPAARGAFMAVVPVALEVSRSGENLTVSFDARQKQMLMLAAGQGMLKGIKSEMRFYPKGTERPSQPDGGLSLSSSVESIFTQNQETKITVRLGTSYVVEEDLTIFETDVPTQHIGRRKVARTTGFCGKA